MTYKTKISKWRVNYFRNMKLSFQNITIHGIPRMLLSNSCLEIIFWIIIFVSALYYFFILLINNLNSFNNKPLIKTIDTVAYPTSLLPFPAVTVCNYNTVYKPKSDKIVELLIKNGIEESLARSFFSNLALLEAPTMFDPYPYRKVYKVLSKIGYNRNTQLMQDIAQPCTTLLNYCSWAGQEVNCSLLFTRSKAQLGFCCSFNSHLYPLNPNENQEYFTTAGPLQGLHIQFNISANQYVPIASYNNAGLSVYVHEIDTYADETSFFALVEPGKEVYMKMVPNIYGTTNDIRNVKHNIRKCWFNEEGPNVFNVNYTFENCMHMCKTITIGNLCNCVPYSHPDYVNWNSCSLIHIPCLGQKEDLYMNLYTVLNNHETVKNQTVCNCMPPCTGINYDGTLDVLSYQNPNGDTFLNKSGVRIFFQNNWCKKYTVQKSMQTDELVALVGGLFALCLGGSILSVIEFVVFFMKCFFGINNSEETQAVFQPQLYWNELKYYKKKIPRNRQKVQYPVHWESLIN